MNSDILQGLRYSLQKRVRRLNSAGTEPTYSLTLRKFWHFLKNSPLLWGILEDLRLRLPLAAKKAEAICEGESEFDPATEEEHAALALALIQRCVESKEDSPVLTVSYCLQRTRSSRTSDYAQQFHDLLTEPLYEYLDEELDGGRAVLGILLRYKQRCEWFRRENLFRKWQSETNRGEKILALDLYEYLYEHGFHFSIEPSSASGEADLVEAQTGDDRLIADAKISEPDSGKDVSYLAKAINQLYIYTQDFNQPIGYLIVFKASAADLRLALSDVVSHIPVFSHNNKSLFILIIDIYPHYNSASKRGKLKVLEIAEDDLLAIVN